MTIKSSLKRLLTFVKYHDIMKSIAAYKLGYEQIDAYSLLLLLKG